MGDENYKNMQHLPTEAEFQRNINVIQDEITRLNIISEQVRAMILYQQASRPLTVQEMEQLYRTLHQKHQIMQKEYSLTRKVVSTCQRVKNVADRLGTLQET